MGKDTPKQMSTFTHLIPLSETLGPFGAMFPWDFAVFGLWRELGRLSGALAVRSPWDLAGTAKSIILLAGVPHFRTNGRNGQGEFADSVELDGHSVWTILALH